MSTQPTYTALPTSRLMSLCLLLAGTIPRDEETEAKILSALMVLRGRLDPVTFLETLRVVDGITNKFAAFHGEEN